MMINNNIYRKICNYNIEPKQLKVVVIAYYPEKGLLLMGNKTRELSCYSLAVSYLKSVGIHNLNLSVSDKEEDSSAFVEMEPDMKMWNKINHVNMMLSMNPLAATFVPAYHSNMKHNETMNCYESKVLVQIDDTFSFPYEIASNMTLNEYATAATTNKFGVILNNMEILKRSVNGNMIFLSRLSGEDYANISNIIAYRNNNLIGEYTNQSFVSMNDILEGRKKLDEMSLSLFNSLKDKLIK